MDNLIPFIILLIGAAIVAGAMLDPRNRVGSENAYTDDEVDDFSL